MGSITITSTTTIIIKRERQNEKKERKKDRTKKKIKNKLKFWKRTRVRETADNQNFSYQHHNTTLP